ncbi:MAG TPA: substrate-binding domain-containing protein [Rhodoferax sp.]|nr:substrate-binding domain-containing protein [Rhodoferax sp.]HOS86091.1 substrate-binding domain-containing protein [Burkholderiaceae bacterium]HPL79331.1 substrate-binding domain-containing protein [Burkholderiaceae bacterium]
MYKVAIQPHWEITSDADVPLDTAVLLELLVAIKKTGSIAQAAQTIGLSYRYAWGLLRDVEKLFGDTLMDKGRGRGTVLTPLAEKLIWADRRVAARLSPMLESLSSELELELNKMTAGKSRTVRLHASHGFAVAALLNDINNAKLPIELRYRNSTEAVAALSRQECDLAGFHVPLGDFEKPAVALYAQWLNKKTHRLIHLAVRSQGLFVATGNPQGIHGLQDLTREGVRFVNRQVGSGTRMLLELMLEGASLSPNDINGFENTEFTHSAVAAFIASGMAEVGFGVHTAAQRFGLEFIPLVQERYFFALPVSALDDPLIQQVIGLLQSASFREEVDTLAGYDATDTGKILSLAEAFGSSDPTN